MTSITRALLILMVSGAACRSRDGADQTRSDTRASDSQPAPTLVAISRDSQAALDRRQDSISNAEVNRRIDSVAPFIIALEDSLANFPAHPHRAAWLWQLGDLWSKHLAGYACEAMGPQPALGVKYAQYFNKHCCECELNYDYTHWKTLIAEFPSDPRAADAAYGFTNKEWGGECEGQVSCWIDRTFESLSDFLRRYPNSSHAAEAVERANEAFTRALTFRPGENELFELHDADVVALIARYDSTAAGLPLPLRARAYRVIGPLWTMFGNDARAAALYRLASESAPPGDTAGLRRTWDSLVAKLKAPRPPPPPPDPVLSNRDLDIGAVRHDESMSVVRERFGEPDSILLEPHPRYPDGRTKLVTWFYRTRYRVIVDYQSWGAAQTVVTTDSALSTSRGIRVGDAADSVRARYGAPGQIDGDYWIYPAEDYPKIILRFTIKKGRVAEILAGSVGPRGQ